MMRNRSSLATLSAAVLFLCTLPAEAEINLSFGLYTSNKPTAMVKKFRPVLNAVETRLAAALGEPVEIRIQVAKSYARGIEHLASGRVDFSRFGPASYIEAKRANEGLKILAMESQEGDKVFYGIIAVAEDSPIHSVEDLRGRSFAFGSEQSTIGRYLSQQFLRDHDIYAPDLSRFDYLERHDKVGTAVGAGHFDAGALNEATFNKLVAKGVRIRELARFPNVTKPWIAREGLPERVFLALREALMGLDDPAALKALKKDGFVSGEDQDYAPTRLAIEENDKFFQQPERHAATNEPLNEVNATPDEAPAADGSRPTVGPVGAPGAEVSTNHDPGERIADYTEPAYPAPDTRSEGSPATGAADDEQGTPAVLSATPAG